MNRDGKILELYELRSRLRTIEAERDALRRERGDVNMLESQGHDVSDHYIGITGLKKRITHLEKEIDTMRSELILAYEVIDQLPESALEHCKTDSLLKLMRKTEQTSKLEMVKTEMNDRLMKMKEQNKKLKIALEFYMEGHPCGATECPSFTKACEALGQA